MIIQDILGRELTLEEHKELTDFSFDLNEGGWNKYDVAFKYLHDKYLSVSYRDNEYKNKIIGFAKHNIAAEKITQRDVIKLYSEYSESDIKFNIL